MRGVNHAEMSLSNDSVHSEPWPLSLSCGGRFALQLLCSGEEQPMLSNLLHRTLILTGIGKDGPPSGREGGIYMAKIEMPHADHEKHLCLLKNVGYVKRHLDDYKALVRDAKYVCRKCGRAAARKKNLCKPDKF
jgi:hypothetical protein